MASQIEDLKERPHNSNNLSASSLSLRQSFVSRTKQELRVSLEQTGTAVRSFSARHGWGIDTSLQPIRALSRLAQNLLPLTPSSAESHRTEIINEGQRPSSGKGNSREGQIQLHGKRKVSVFAEIKRSTVSESLSQEVEERALAQALASGRRATLLSFYSPQCRLCRSLHPTVQELRQREASWLNVVSLNATSTKWMPEVSYYSIAYVPCFVLLDSRGRAMAKSGEPYSRRHVLKGLSYLLESLRPVKKLVAQ